MRKRPVLLTFDVDGEMIWRCRDPENADRPVTLSLGHYGLDRGLPRILKVLKKYDAPATFFVPGMTAEMFPYTLTSILDEGIHEIGHHSYSHTYPDKFPNKEAEAEDYERVSTSTSKSAYKITSSSFSPKKARCSSIIVSRDW